MNKEAIRAVLADGLTIIDPATKTSLYYDGSTDRYYMEWPAAKTQAGRYQKFLTFESAYSAFNWTKEQR